MALDTREKRASAVSLTPSAPNTVTPNAAKDQEWRQESGWGYSGITIGLPVAGTVALTLPLRSIALTLPERSISVILAQRSIELGLPERSVTRTLRKRKVTRTVDR